MFSGSLPRFHQWHFQKCLLWPKIYFFYIICSDAFGWCMSCLSAVIWCCSWKNEKKTWLIASFSLQLSRKLGLTTWHAGKESTFSRLCSSTRHLEKQKIQKKDAGHRSSRSRSKTGTCETCLCIPNDEEAIDQSFVQQ